MRLRKMPHVCRNRGKETHVLRNREKHVNQERQRMHLPNMPCPEEPSFKMGQILPQGFWYAAV